MRHQSRKIATIFSAFPTFPSGCLETPRKGVKEIVEANSISPGQGPLAEDRTQFGPFIDYKTLRGRLPLCDRTLRELIRKGVLPSIALPGGRKRLFYWPAVEAALRRFQRGGVS